MRSCIICGKPLGDKKAPDLKCCKKHQHILDTLFPNRESQAEVNSISFYNRDSDLIKIRNLEDFEKAWNLGFFIIE
jgi:hypothetical protein